MFRIKTLSCVPVAIAQDERVQQEREDINDQQFVNWSEEEKLDERERKGEIEQEEREMGHQGAEDPQRQRLFEGYHPQN